MKNKIFGIVFFSGIIALILISGCGKDTAKQPLEPISLVAPDSAIIYKQRGDSVPIELKFTTDRPINYVQGLYDIDTILSTNYIPTYPDTLFLIHLQTMNPRVNLYTYNGVYFIPDSLKPQDIIRFRVYFNAGSSSFVTGQNYPAGIVSSTKEFKVVLK